MASYMYVDTKPYEVIETPKSGPQYKLWYGAKSRSHPEGQEYRDILNGQEVFVRAISKEKLQEFRDQIFTRILPIKVIYTEE